MADIAEIIDNFSLLDDWDDRYRYLIELGRDLPPLAAEAHNDANKVQGCASQVWLDTSVRPNGAGGRGAIVLGERRAHSRHRRRCAVRKNRVARTSHTAAFERFSLHGRAHPLRCALGARDRG